MPDRIFTIFLTLQLLSATVYAETIRVGLAMPRDLKEVIYINGMYRLFKEEVETKSNGELRVQIYYGGVLGKPDERLNQMRRNVIQMSDASDGNYATIHRDIQVFSIPYIFPDIETALKVLDGPIGSRVAEDIRVKTGIRVLGWWETAGFKHYSASSPIYNPADMKGKKMRVMSAVFSIPVNALGGTAIPIPMNELYISLKTGVVDGQDNAVAVFNMQKLYEVQNYIILDGHTYGFGPLGINDEFFNSLNREQQKIILNAGTRAVAWNRVMSQRVENDAIKYAQSMNVKIIRVSEERRRQFAEKAQPAVIEWLKSNVNTPSLVDEVLAETARLSGTSK